MASVPYYSTNGQKKRSYTDSYFSEANPDYKLGVSGDELTTDLEGAPYQEPSLFEGIGEGLSKAWDTGTDFLSKAFGGGSSDSKSSTGILGTGMSWGDAADVAKGIGSIWDAYASSEYKEEIVSMEKERVAREVDKQKKAQAALEKAWA